MSPVLNSMGLGFVFTAKDLASGTIRQVGGAFGALDQAAIRAQASYHRNMQAMTAGIAIMGAGLGVLAGATELAEMAGHFEQALARLGGVSRATAQEMQLLHDKAIEVGVATMFDPTEAVEGLTALAEKGFTVREQLALILPAAQLAEGGAMEIATAAEAMSAAVRVFGQDASQAADDADMMLASQQTSALQARDMVQAFAGVSRGASLTHQSLSEMLIAMGFVRDTGADVSVSAQSVSSALVFMASRADKFREIGISVTDAQGNFRPFLDVVRETSVALQTRFPNAADRTAKALELFSRFGLSAYAATTANLERGIRTTTGEVLHGAAAIDYLRQRFATAARENAAEEFQQRLLSTFAGQQRLMRGSLHTLGIIVGEGFTAALKPYVSTVVRGINAVIGLFQRMPIGVRTAIAHMTLMFGVLLTGAGATIALGAAIAILLPLLKAVAISVLGLVVAMAPFLAIFGAAVGAVLLFRYIVERNLGGVGEAVERFTNGVSLGFRAISSLFESGGFSGPLVEELHRADNLGIRAFAIRVYQIGFRILQFFRGVRIGFTAAIDALAPSLTVAREAFEKLGDAIGLTADNGAKMIAGMPSSTFARLGATIGSYLGRAVEVLVDLATIGAKIATGFVEGWSAVSTELGPTFSAIGDSFGMLGDQLEQLMELLGVTTHQTDAAGGGWATFGRVLSGVIGVAALFLGGAVGAINVGLAVMIDAVRLVIEGFKAIATFGELAGIATARAWMNVSDAVMNAADQIALGVVRVVQAIPAGMRTAGMDELVSQAPAIEERAARRQAGNVVANTRFDLMRAQATAGPAAADAETRAHATQTTGDALFGVKQLIEEQRAARARETIHVAVQVDGETIARAQANGQRRIDADNFRDTEAEG